MRILYILNCTTMNKMRKRKGPIHTLSYSNKLKALLLLEETRWETERVAGKHVQSRAYTKNKVEK